MSYSSIEYNGNSINRVFTIPFNYIDESHITVVDDMNMNNNFEFISKQQIIMDFAPIETATLRIQRHTPVDKLMNYFDSASVLEGSELDADLIQLLNSIQEIADVLNDNGQDITEFFNDISMNGFKITDLGNADLNEDFDAANVFTVKQLIEKYKDGGAITDYMIVGLEGQTDFTLPFKYVRGINALAVYVAGVRQSPIHITELDDYSFRLGEACEGGEEVYALISDQPATSIEFPQAKVDVLGGGFLASIPQIDEGLDDKTLITPATLQYKMSKLDTGTNIDQGILKKEDDIQVVAQGKYYITDFNEMQGKPPGFSGIGVLTKASGFYASQGGLIIAYANDGNTAYKVKTNSLWGDWFQVNEMTVTSILTPEDDDGRPDGTIFYQLEE